MKKLVEAEGLAEFVEMLRETDYREDLEKLKELDPYLLEGIFHSKLIQRVDRLIEIAPQNVAYFLEARYRLGVEILNIKRILRGKPTKTMPERIRRIVVPVKPYSALDLDRLIELESLEDCIKAFEGTMYAPVVRTLDVYRKYESLWPIESMLDRVHLDVVGRALDGMPAAWRRSARAIVYVEGDLENLLLAMSWRSKLAEMKIEAKPKEIFSAVYSIPREILFDLVVAEKIDEKVVRHLPPPFPDLMDLIVEGNEPLARARLRAYLYRLALRESRREPEFPFVMLFVQACDTERANLISIMWGKARGMSPTEILKHVVTPER